MARAISGLGMTEDSERPNRQHGGRRAGAGRPKILNDDMILAVGWACETLQRKAYDRQLAAAKQSIFSDATNLSEFFGEIASIPIQERSDYLLSQEFEEHRSSIDEELRVIGQPAGLDGKPSRIITFKLKRIYGVNEGIYVVVGELFGLTRNQVKKCWREYRKLNFWNI